MIDACRILAQWGARVETPGELATRFTRMIDALPLVHSILDDWDWIDGPTVAKTDGKAGTVPWQEAQTDLEQAIVRNMASEDDGIPRPFCGYWLPVVAHQQSADRRLSLAVTASKGEGGGSSLFPFMNRVVFGSGAAPDPSLLCFDVWHRLLLALAETWEATWAEAATPGLVKLKSGSPVRVAWMSYVSPHFAPLMTPPTSAVVERRPNGGLFLAATREVFDSANAAHLAVAREIEAALQPLNRVPNPNDAPYL